MHVQVAKVGVALGVGWRWRQVQQIGYRRQLGVGIVDAAPAEVVDLLRQWRLATTGAQQQCGK